MNTSCEMKSGAVPPGSPGARADGIHQPPEVNYSDVLEKGDFPSILKSVSFVFRGNCPFRNGVNSSLLVAGGSACERDVLAEIQLLLCTRPQITETSSYATMATSPFRNRWWLGYRSGTKPGRFKRGGRD